MIGQMARRGHTFHSRTICVIIVASDNGIFRMCLYLMSDIAIGDLQTGHIFHFFENKLSGIPSAFICAYPQKKNKKYFPFEGPQLHSETNLTAVMTMSGANGICTCRCEWSPRTFTINCPRCFMMNIFHQLFHTFMWIPPWPLMSNMTQNCLYLHC